MGKEAEEEEEGQYEKKMQHDEHNQAINSGPVVDEKANPNKLQWTSLD